MDSQNKGLEHLELWQVALDFAHKVCQQVIPMMPSEEKWVLSTQLRRAVQSLPANIAEGYGRYYYQDNVRFCYIARGSLEETFSHLTLANRLNYLTDLQYSPLVEDIHRLRRLLNGYIAYLKTSKRGASEPGFNLSIRENPEIYLVDSPADLNRDLSKTID
jgi:four helix bundle protein